MAFSIDREKLPQLKNAVKELLEKRRTQKIDQRSLTQAEREHIDLLILAGLDTYLLKALETAFVFDAEHQRNEHQAFLETVGQALQGVASTDSEQKPLLLALAHALQLLQRETFAELLSLTPELADTFGTKLEFKLSRDTAEQEIIFAGQPVLELKKSSKKDDRNFFDLLFYTSVQEKILPFEEFFSLCHNRFGLIPYSKYYSLKEEKALVTDMVKRLQNWIDRSNLHDLFALQLDETVETVAVLPRAILEVPFSYDVERASLKIGDISVELSFQENMLLQQLVFSTQPDGWEDARVLNEQLGFGQRFGVETKVVSINRRFYLNNLYITSVFIEVEDSPESTPDRKIIKRLRINPHFKRQLSENKARSSVL